jgi:hypothetical protein
MASSDRVNRLVRLYCLVLGIALTAEGLTLLAAQAVGLLVGDVPHNILHVAWGIAVLVLIRFMRASVVALVFGVFYTALAISGVLVHDPFGLQLGPGENIFHFVVGPLALLLGLWSSISARSASTSGSTAAPSAPPVR